MNTIERPDLAHPSAALRLRAVREADPAADLAKLVGIVAEDPAVDVRLAALDRLAQAGSYCASRGAEAALAVADERVRIAAVGLLQPDQLEDMVHLACALRDPSPDVAIVAAGSLLRSGSPEACALVWCTLWSVPSARADLLIGEIARHKPQSLRVPARAATASPLPDERARGHSVNGSLAHPDDEQVTLLGLRDTDAVVRLAALRHLEPPLASSTVSALGVLMRDPDDAVRAAAVVALHRSEDDRALSFLLVGARDRSPEVRKAARTAVLDRRCPSLIRLLLSSLSDPRLRRTAGEILVQIGPDVADLASAEPETVRDAPADSLRAIFCVPLLFERLQSRLRDSQASARAGAVDLIARACSPESAQSLLPLLQDPDPGIRALVASRLAELGDGRALPHLRQAFVREPDLDLIPTIEDAIRSISDQSSDLRPAHDGPVS